MTSKSTITVERRKLLLATAVGLATTAMAGVAIAAPVNADPIFAAIDDHRALFAAMEKAEDDFNADPEEKEEGPLADRLHEAFGDQREAFRELLATEPRTPDGWFALVGYVVEVGGRQEAKGHYDDGPEMLFANLKRVAALRAAA